MKFILFLLLTVVLFSCSEQEKKTDIKNYFFPLNLKEDKVYVYADSLNGIDERSFRIYNTLEQDKEYFNLEKYAADFRNTEAYKYAIADSLKVTDHMVVGIGGEKFKATLRANTLFPTDFDTEVYFASVYPSYIKNFVTAYEVKSRVVQTGLKYNFDGVTYDAILIRDSLKVTTANPKTEQGNVNLIAIDNLYAKDLGLVRFGSTDNMKVYKLKKIYSKEEWDFLKENLM